VESIRALTFDVQGTSADFCRPMQRMGEAVNRAKGLAIDWGSVSAEWRGLYRTVLDDVIAGRRPWLRVDRIYRETLDTLLERS
jgi:2-haloacid dehalogenase